MIYCSTYELNIQTWIRLIGFVEAHICWTLKNFAQKIARQSQYHRNQITERDHRAHCCGILDTKPISVDIMSLGWSKWTHFHLPLGVAAVAACYNSINSMSENYFDRASIALVSQKKWKSNWLNCLCLLIKRVQCFCSTVVRARI